MTDLGDRKKKSAVVSRRDFLRVGGLSVVGLSIAEQAALARAQDKAGRKSCIFLLMTGGPSQLDTFDPKPDAPSEVRGPLRAIQTRIPGVLVNESLPRIADRMHELALIRSLNHQAAPIHETGFQLLQTGRLSNGEGQFPSFGAVTAQTLGGRGAAPASVVLPKFLSNTGVNTYHGQSAGFLGSEYAPLVLDTQDKESHVDLLDEIRFEQQPESVRREYGQTRVGRLCWQARQLVELGVRCVTVNLFDTLANQMTWDCHASQTGMPTTLFDYREVLCPQFDRAYTALVEDLQRHGLFDDTLVVATGEFGRTPRLNQNGGRDHWPAVWSALVAGGGVNGGQVVGSSDSQGAEPATRPVSPAELTATIYQGFGLELDDIISDNKTEMPMIEAAPISELFS